MGAESWSIHGKYKLLLLPHTIRKVNSKWIIDINIELKV
jgi:hypothetical protein